MGLGRVPVLAQEIIGPPGVPQPVPGEEDHRHVALPDLPLQPVQPLQDGAAARLGVPEGAHCDRLVESALLKAQFRRHRPRVLRGEAQRRGRLRAIGRHPDREGIEPGLVEGQRPRPADREHRRLARPGRVPGDQGDHRVLGRERDGQLAHALAPVGVRGGGGVLQDPGLGPVHPRLHPQHGPRLGARLIEQGQPGDLHPYPGLGRDDPHHRRQQVGDGRGGQGRGRHPLGVRPLGLGRTGRGRWGLGFGCVRSGPAGGIRPAQGLRRVAGRQGQRDHLRAGEARAQARGRVEVRRRVRPPVQVPADQVLAPGRGGIVPERGPEHPAAPVRVRVQGQDLGPGVQPVPAQGPVAVAGDRAATVRGAVQCPDGARDRLLPAFPAGVVEGAQPPLGAEDGGGGRVRPGGVQGEGARDLVGLQGQGAAVEPGRGVVHPVGDRPGGAVRGQARTLVRQREVRQGRRVRVQGQGQGPQIEEGGALAAIPQAEGEAVTGGGETDAVPVQLAAQVGGGQGLGPADGRVRRAGRRRVEPPESVRRTQQQGPVRQGVQGHDGIGRRLQRSQTGPEPAAGPAEHRARAALGVAPAGIEGPAVGGPGDLGEIAVVDPRGRRRPQVGEGAAVQQIDRGAVVVAHRDPVAVR